MYYALFLPEKGWTRQSVEVRKDASLSCGARRFALRVSAGAQAGGRTRRVDLVGQPLYFHRGASYSKRLDVPRLGRWVRRWHSVEQAAAQQAHHVFSRVTAPENCGTMGA